VPTKNKTTMGNTQQIISSTNNIKK